MNIKTRLNTQDFTQAYKNLGRFLFQHPVIAAVLLLLAGLVSQLSVTQFPLKMAALVALIGFSVAIVTTQYRTGSLSQLLAELKYQQPVWLVVITGVGILSWGGLWVAQQMLALKGFEQASAHSANTMFDGPAVGGMVIGAALVCMAQILPLVLGYFCHSLGLNKQQGEAIWLKLLTQIKMLVAFVPIASLAVGAALAGFDVSTLFVMLSALYATFVLFIVFEISPCAPREVSRFIAAPQSGQC